MAQKIKRRTFIRTSPAFALVFGACIIAGCSWLGKPELVLVEGGKANIPIVVSGGASAETLRAADDLAEYIGKVGGARPEVIHDPVSIPKSAIWVGAQPRLSKVFRDLDMEFKHPEEILLACNGKHLLVAGRDLTVNGMQVEHGTANAVYTFIEKYLDVRWLWPGELGEDIPRKDTIALPSFVYRFHPVFLRRETFQSAARWGLSDDWTRFQRLKLSSLETVWGAHAFSSWWDRFHEEHPDWFALQPDGTRSGYPEPKMAKMCLSNPEIQDQWLAEVEEVIKKNPRATVFSAGENDSYSTGLCVCENCRAWDHPEGAPWTYTWEGHSEEYVASTNRNVTFWNHLARKLKERFPDRDNLYALGLAYGSSISPPVGIEMEDNIIVSFVGRFPVSDDNIRQEGKANLSEWAKIAAHMYYRPNLWYWTGGLWGLPDMALKNVVEDFPFLAENNVMGIRVDNAREHWSTQGPQYYLMGQLTWDPFQDGQAVLEDYYRRGFGKAAEKIRAYWDLMEQAREKATASPGYGPHGSYRFHLLKIFQDVYSEDFFGQAYDLLRQAEGLVAGEPEIYRERVGFVRTGLEFTRLMVDNISLMDRVRESRGKDREAITKVTENWEAIKGLYDHTGPIALNYKDLLRAMQSERYMAPMEDYFGPVSEEFLKASGEGYVPQPKIEPTDMD